MGKKFRQISNTCHGKYGYHSNVVLLIWEHHPGIIMLRLLAYPKSELWQSTAKISLGYHKQNQPLFWVPLNTVNVYIKHDTSTNAKESGSKNGS